MDEFSSWVTQLRKGFVELLVLQLLATEPRHGYGIVQELREIGDLVAGEATVYPVLRRLEAAGSVTASWEQRDSGNPRKYYAITNDGRAFLTRALEEWEKTENAVTRLRRRS